MSVEQLSADEQLAVRVALATCFAYPFRSGQVPPADVEQSVKELVSLYALKPHAGIRARGTPACSRSRLCWGSRRARPCRRSSIRFRGGLCRRGSR